METDRTEIVVKKILDFLEEIGIGITLEHISGETALPGIRIEPGALVVDLEQLLYPGDLLHEAGHLAVVPPDVRARMSDKIDPAEDLKYGGELMAIPWSYAACLHLQIDPAIVFHEHGYRGASQSILENFAQGRYFGVPMLQWAGMTVDEKRGAELGISPFPNMLRWIRETPHPESDF